MQVFTTILCERCGYTKEFKSENEAKIAAEKHDFDAHGPSFDSYWRTIECFLTTGFYEPIKKAYIAGYKEGKEHAQKQT